MAKNYDAAFRLYIKSANAYLHLSRSAPSDVQKEKWKTSTSKALERAEKIKSFVERQKAGSSTSSESATGQTEGIAPGASEIRLTPVAVDHFSSREWYVVRDNLLIRMLFYRGTIPRSKERRSNQRANVLSLG